MVHGSRRYDPPTVTDYGGLWEITATAHPMMATVHDLSFSSPGPGQTPTSPGGSSTVLPTSSSGGPVAHPGSVTHTTIVPTVSHHTVTSGAAPSHSTGPGGIQTISAGSGTEGRLPFTGFAAGAAAAVGSGLTAVGGALRWATRLPRRPN